MTTLSESQNESFFAARILNILHLIINNAYFIIKSNLKKITSTYFTSNNTDSALRLLNVFNVKNARMTMTDAVNTVLLHLYTIRSDSITNVTTNIFL